MSSPLDAAWFHPIEHCNRMGTSHAVFSNLHRVGRLFRAGLALCGRDDGPPWANGGPPRQRAALIAVKQERQQDRPRRTDMQSATMWLRADG
jgi:hypothetical protein